MTRFINRSVTFTPGEDEVSVNVTGTYYPGCPETRETPPEDGEVDICSVLFDGANILPILNEAQYLALQEATIKAIEEDGR